MRGGVGDVVSGMLQLRRGDRGTEGGLIERGRWKVACLAAAGAGNVIEGIGDAMAIIGGEHLEAPRQSPTVQEERVEKGTGEIEGR